MGCSVSKPTKVSNRSPNSPSAAQMKISLQKSKEEKKLESEDSPCPSYKLITKGVQAIIYPSDLHAVVCLDKKAFPILASSLPTEDSIPSLAQLPILAASFYGKGRVIVISQIKFFDRASINYCNTKRFFQNVIGWVAGSYKFQEKMVCVGFDKEMQKSLISTLREIGCYIESGNLDKQINNAKIVLISSSFVIQSSQETRLINYLNSGGGVIVAYHELEGADNFIAINSFLIKTNLAFTPVIINENLTNPGNFTMAPNYTYLEHLTFPKLIESFGITLESNAIDTQYLDDLITVLRFHITVCSESQEGSLSQILEICWKYMNDHNYNKDGMICYDNIQPMLTALILDASYKIPLSKITFIPDSVFFPGETMNPQLMTGSIVLTVEPGQWISTGFWLPAGMVSDVNVEFSNPDDKKNHMHIQIGSHTEVLFIKPCPWKRWPSIVRCVDLKYQDDKIVSLFGGMIYIVSDEENVIENVSFTFTNVIRYPYNTFSNPSIWKETLFNNIPWGEIRADGIIFTLPSESMKAFPSFDDIFNTYSTIITEVKSFLACDNIPDYRVVFDCELTGEGPNCGYPVVFNLEATRQLLSSIKSPTVELFTLITFLSLDSLPEHTFDIEVETAIATLCSFVAMRKVYSNIDPYSFAANYSINLPTLFDELWTIHVDSSGDVISKALKRFQSPMFKPSPVSEDAWIDFVSELCRAGHKNFTTFLESVKPVPLNLSISLQPFPVFVPKVQ